MTLLLLVALTAGLVGNARPALANPATTHSRYIGGTGSYTANELYNLGCARASAGETGAIILAFGRPRYISGTGWGVQVLGGSGQFMSLSDVTIRASFFAAGFYACASGSTYATIIVGTSNFGDELTYDHGQQWAYTVTNVQSFITSPPSIAARVQAHGGSDIELDWNPYDDPSVDATVNWVQGYDSVNTRSMYNFGDAAGCPASRSGNVTGQTSSSSSCNSDWTQQRVRYVSWGNPAAYPFPAIYSEGSTYSDQAIEWQRISNYSKRAYGSAMVIGGVLTQKGACDDIGGSSQCPGTYNTPTQGYDQLWNALNYLDSGYVAQTPQWLTDIDWQ